LSRELYRRRTIRTNAENNVKGAQVVRRQSVEDPRGRARRGEAQISPTRGRPGGFHFNLSREECGVIGLAMIQWAFLENALFERTKALAKRGRIRLPKEG
jgi:hypothetical protein